MQVIHFPDYQVPTGARIGAYLRGELALTASEVQELFAANRREKLEDIRRAASAHDVLILDRYFPSAWAYGVARGFSAEWMASLDAGLPAPDVVAVLDVPVERVLSRMAGRPGRGPDRYEQDVAFLERVRAAYLRLAREHGWAVIPGERPPEEIAEEILALLRARGLPAHR